MNFTFHYPPELMESLIETIPLLCKSYESTLLFFQGAGVGDDMTRDLREIVRTDRKSINKYKIVRTVLTRLNERGDSAIRERREVLKRVVEFEDYSSCWPNDQLKAKGLVAEIRRTVDVKDTFTRMKQERDDERRERIAARDAEINALNEHRAILNTIKDELFALFSETNNPHKRGKSLEGILNRLFKAHNISIRDSFTLCGESGEGIVEQIDGVIELDGHLYFVEMKWWKEPLGVPEISEHLVRVYGRAETRAIIISASDFTTPAISLCRDALSQKVVALCTLRELVTLLDQALDLSKFLKAKAHAAITHKNPCHDPIAAGEI